MKTFDDIVSKILENPDFNQLNEDILNLQKNIKEILDNRENLVGKRVKMVYTSDAYTDVVPGDTGTVSHVDDAGTVFVNWDCGSGLGLIPGIDIFEVVNEN
jgi:hypothetical protein